MNSKQTHSQVMYIICHKLFYGHLTIGICIDLKKAFDMVNHKTVLKKLEFLGPLFFLFMLIVL